MADQPVVAILGTSGWLNVESDAPAGDIIRLVGNNTGNLVFQHSVQTLINAPFRSIGAAGASYGDPHAFKGVSHIIFPAANLLQPGLHLKPLAGFLRKCPVPLIVLGLGAQANSMTPSAAQIAAIASDPDVQVLADAMKERAAFISVRGAFSLRVCEALGIDAVEVWGCPSLLLNPLPDLGVTLKRGLDLLRGDQGHVRLAVSAAAPFEIHTDLLKLAAERKLVAWMRERPSVYIQQSGGPDVLELARGRLDLVAPEALESMRDVLAPEMSVAEFAAFSGAHQRLFTDARGWLECLSTYDLSLGTRMHGTMISIGAGLPSIHIAHDSRTAELAKTMHLPIVTLADVVEAETLCALVGRTRFDSGAFDANRREIARRFVAMTEAVGLKATANVRRLAFSLHNSDVRAAG